MEDKAVEQLLALLVDQILWAVGAVVGGRGDLCICTLEPVGDHYQGVGIDIGLHVPHAGRRVQQQCAGPWYCWTTLHGRQMKTTSDNMQFST